MRKQKSGHIITLKLKALSNWYMHNFLVNTPSSWDISPLKARLGDRALGPLGSRANLLRELRWWSWRNSKAQSNFCFFGVSLDMLDPVLVGSQRPRAKAIWQFKTDQRLKRLWLSYTFLGPKKINENFRILKWSYCTTKRPYLGGGYSMKFRPKKKALYMVQVGTLW